MTDNGKGTKDTETVDEDFCCFNASQLVHVSDDGQIGHRHENRDKERDLKLFHPLEMILFVLVEAFGCSDQIKRLCGDLEQRREEEKEERPLTLVPDHRRRRLRKWPRSWCRLVLLVLLMTGKDSGCRKSQRMCGF